MRIYRNDAKNPEIDTTTNESHEMTVLDHHAGVFFGGRCDNTDNWEGRLDEIAVFDRVLSEDEIAKVFGN